MDGPSELLMYGRLTTQDVHRMWRGSSMTQKLPFSKIKLNLIIFLFYLNVWYASIEVRANVCISHPQCHKKPPATKSPFTSILKSPKNLSSVCAKKKNKHNFFCWRSVDFWPSEVQSLNGTKYGLMGMSEFYKYWMFDVSNEVCDDMKGAKIILSLLLLFFFKKICPLCSHRNKSWEWGQTNQTGGREDWSLVWFLVYWQPM